MRKGILFSLLFVFVIIVLSSLVQANIQSCKDDFKTNEPVKFRSIGKFCFDKSGGDLIDFYIVTDKGAVSLNILEEGKIQNSVFSCLSVWENPVAGKYEFFADCNGNGEYYSDSNEPSGSFTVTAVKGTGTVSKDSTDKGDHSWMYDSEEPNLVNEMIKLRIEVLGEDANLENITLKSFGTGNDSEIKRIEIYIDNTLEGESEGAYSQDNGEITIPLDISVKKGVLRVISVVYIMEQTTPVGTYSLSVDSVYAIGKNSEGVIKFSGTPISSGITTIKPAKTCLGKLALELIPNPAVFGETVTAKLSGLTGCAGKTVVLKPNPCGSSLQTQLSSCVLSKQDEIESCEANFTASASQTIHSCIDKNEDGDLIDFGEYAFEDLVLTEPLLEEQETGEINLTESFEEIEGLKEQERQSITGGLIEEIKEKIPGTNNLFVLLEITLLLILLVLVLILFKLKGSRNSGRERSSE